MLISWAKWGLGQVSSSVEAAEHAVPAETDEPLEAEHHLNAPVSLDTWLVQRKSGEMIVAVVALGDTEVDVEMVSQPFAA
jgi:hypothetical protein